MGATSYLPKTGYPANLRARIASSLARKRLHDAEREAVERQAATNEVLAIMSRSVFDRDVVLKAIVEAAVRLCRADYGVAYLLAGETFRVAASAGGNSDLDAFERDHPIKPGRETLDAETRRMERVLLLTRIRDGLSVAELEASGRTAVAGLIADGLVDAKAALAGSVVLTLRGRLLADAVVRRLLPEDESSVLS